MFSLRISSEWGTKAVYELLKEEENNPIKQQSGKFSFNDLEKIWSDNRYQGKYRELLDLMKRFKLCYELKESTNTNRTYIAPQLLTKEKPNYRWDENDNLLLRYTYDFMPKGIITQFIVVMHELIEDIDKKQKIWRNGVILHENDTRAEIIEYYEERKITIRVSGKNKKNLMTIVTYQLDKIHNSYKNRLKVDKLIPCICKVCKGKPNPHVYKFNNLLERLANNKQTVECDRPPYETIQVSSLIEDYWNEEQVQINLKYQQRIEELEKFSHSTTNVYKANTIHQTTEVKTVTGDEIKQTGTFGIGVNKGEVKTDKLAGTINEAQSKTLAETAAEIQQLLEQLSQAYPTSTSKEKMTLIAEAVDRIETNPTLRAKVINGLKAGGTEALKEAIDHPLVNILMASIEDLQEVE